MQININFFVEVFVIKNNKVTYVLYDKNKRLCNKLKIYYKLKNI